MSFLPMEILKGISLLRFPEVRWALGQMRLKAKLLNEIRQSVPGIKLSDGIEIVGYESGRLVAGPGVSVCHGTVLAFGDDLDGFGRIRIGSGTWIGQYNNLRACGDGDISIGANCLVSQFCTLVGSNHSVKRERLIVDQGPDRSRLGIVVGDDVWLGSGVAVMPGVAIGNGAVIGANAVVTRPIPEYEIWAGAPAKKIGERN